MEIINYISIQLMFNLMILFCLFFIIYRLYIIEKAQKKDDIINIYGDKE